MNVDEIRERYQRALDAKPSKGDYTPAGIDALTDSATCWPEVDRLTRWKAEALPVMTGLQELGKALGLTLGESITGPSAVDAAHALRARAEAAEQAVERVRELHPPTRDETAATEWCYTCLLPYPCTTIRALDGGEQHG